MKALFVTIIILVFSTIYNIQYGKLYLNTPYTLNSSDKDLQYYQISLKDSINIPNEIKVETQVFQTQDPSTSTIGILDEPFKTRNYNKVKKAVLGQPIILDYEFILSVINKDQNIYLVIYCENCSYKINVLSSFNSNKNFIQMPPLRNLQELQYDFKNDSYNVRITMYSANGLSGLIVAFIMIFISVIACIIMMNIYVHNTALVEQPLKLGRVEA